MVATNEHARRLLDAAVQLGGKHIGTAGSGHHMIEFANGARMPIPATPSDWRGYLNSLRQMERKSGRRLPRQKHGRSRKSVHMASSRATFAERQLNIEVSQKVDAILARAEAIRDALSDLANEGRSRANEDAALALVDEYGRLSERLDTLHRPPLPRIETYLVTGGVA